MTALDDIPSSAAVLIIFAAISLSHLAMYLHMICSDKKRKNTPGRRDYGMSDMRSCSDDRTQYCAQNCVAEVCARIYAGSFANTSLIILHPLHAAARRGPRPCTVATAVELHPPGGNHSAGIFQRKMLRLAAIYSRHASLRTVFLCDGPTLYVTVYTHVHACTCGYMYTAV